jgi:DNA-binding PadR family transcriptional regulator
MAKDVSNPFIQETTTGTLEIIISMRNGPVSELYLARRNLSTTFSILRQEYSSPDDTTIDIFSTKEKKVISKNRVLREDNVKFHTLTEQGKELYKELERHLTKTDAGESRTYGANGAKMTLKMEDILLLSYVAAKHICNKIKEDLIKADETLKKMMDKEIIECTKPYCYRLTDKGETLFNGVLKQAYAFLEKFQEEYEKKYIK